MRDEVLSTVKSYRPKRTTEKWKRKRWFWISCFHSVYEVSFKADKQKPVIISRNNTLDRWRTRQSISHMTPRKVKLMDFDISSKCRHLPKLFERLSATPVPVSLDRTWLCGKFPEWAHCGLSAFLRMSNWVLSKPGYNSPAASRLFLWSEQVPFVEMISWSESPAGCVRPKRSNIRDHIMGSFQ